jgi:hypothetical protein
MVIYPAVLYIKEHSITGMLYFGKTTRDPYKYLGSGKRWLRHIKKHGCEYVKTIWVSELYTDSEEIAQFALAFSTENNIVESRAWANLIPENGLDGVCAGTVLAEATKAKMSAAKLGKTRGPLTNEHKAKIGAARLGKPLTDEHKAKLSAALLGKLYKPRSGPNKPHTYITFCSCKL